MERFEIGNRYIILSLLLVSLSPFLNQLVLSTFQINLYILSFPILLLLIILKFPLNFLSINKHDFCLFFIRLIYSFN